MSQMHCILVDTQLKAIIAVFDNMDKARDAQRKLIIRDLLIFKKILNVRIILNENNIEDLGKLQQIIFIMKKPMERLLSIDVKYTDGTSSLSRYVIYSKDLNAFDISTSNNTNIILIH